jgi:hypothetical protein
MYDVTSETSFKNVQNWMISVQVNNTILPIQIYWQENVAFCCPKIDYKNAGKQNI